MSAKAEISRLIGALSEYECGHLLSAFQDVAAGERFWESEISRVYQEHVKTRLSNRDQRADDVVPIGPDTSSGIFAPIPIAKSYPGAERLPLAMPRVLDAPFGDTLLERRSRRDYTGAAIDEVELATLMRYACGITGATSGYGYRHLPLRTFPTSGGLQSPEVYLSIQAVSGIAPGLYHYHVVDNVLETLREGQSGPFLTALSFQQAQVASASVVVLITGCFERLRWKYGQRAYKYMCMDVGYLGQNICLTAEAMGLGACAIAGFVDDAIEQWLGIDGHNEMLLLLTTVGVTSPPPSQ